MILLVVIVNYRTADLTIDCLRSLEAERPRVPRMSVVVVDNASGDESAPHIAAAISSNSWSSWVSLSVQERNGGFASGNNAAIRPALQSPDAPHYVLLLNPDTLVRPGGVQALVEFMDVHPAVGIAGSRLEDTDGKPQRSAFRFPTVLSEAESGFRVALLTRVLARRVVAPPVPDDAGPAQWVAGASMIVRKEVFDAIGLLDEGYFMYFEEVDFCRRAARAGWPCWYVPQSRVIHLVGQSSGVTDPGQAARPRPAYWFDARRRFFLTHYGPLRTFLADMLWASGFSLWRVRRAILRKPDNEPMRLLRDFIRYNFLRRLGRAAVAGAAAATR